MRYPTRDGLAVSPYEFYLKPTETQISTRRVTSNHHNYFERNRYDMRIRSIFRNLITNVYPLLVSDHNDLHERYTAPLMPPDGLMIEVLDQYAYENGQIDLVYERRTRETHALDLNQWELIKGAFREIHATGNSRLSKPTAFCFASSLPA